MEICNVDFYCNVIMGSLLYVHAKRTCWKIRPRSRAALLKIKMIQTILPDVWCYGFCARLSFFVGCSTSQKHAGVSQRRICSQNCTSCHTEIEVADQTFYLTQYADTRKASSSTDPLTPGARQGSHWSVSL